MKLLNIAALFCLHLSLLFFSATSNAFNLPSNLKHSELNSISNILGFSTGSKFLSNPYPLGGYSGFEVGFDTEIINTADLSSLGDGTSNQSSLQVNRLSVGKGLYGNFDIFMSFIPIAGTDQISSFGGNLKWTFYEAHFLPLTVSSNFQYDFINFHDDFMSENYGFDILVGLNVQKVALYFGGGTISGHHIFSKSILDTTDPANASALSNGSVIKDDHQIHSLIGVHSEFARFFVAAEIDRYASPVYSAKLGMRF